MPFNFSLIRIQTIAICKQKAQQIHKIYSTQTKNAKYKASYFSISFNYRKTAIIGIPKGRCIYIQNLLIILLYNNIKFIGIGQGRKAEAEIILYG